MKDHFKDFYSNAEHHMSEERVSLRFDSVREILEKTKGLTVDRCIDIGGGIYTSLGKMNAVKHAIYIDISEHFCQKFNNIYDTYQADMNDGLPNALLTKIGESSVDVVFCFEVLEHLFCADKLLKDIIRVLKVGGVFIFSVPNETGFYMRKLRLFLSSSIYGNNDNPYHMQHIRFFTTNNLKNFCSEYSAESGSKNAEKSVKGFTKVNISGVNINLPLGLQERLGRPPFKKQLARWFPQCFATNYLCYCVVGEV